MHLRNKTRLDRRLTVGVSIPAMSEIRLDKKTTRILHGERTLLREYIKSGVIEVVKPQKVKNASPPEKELPAGA